MIPPCVPGGLRLTRSSRLDGGPADVSLSIGGATLAGDSREAYEHRRLLTDLTKYLRPGIARNVVGDREGPVRTPAFCMHAAFRNDFAVEVRQLLKQPDVLEQCGAPRASGLNVGVVGDRGAGGVGKSRISGHDELRSFG